MDQSPQEQKAIVQRMIDAGESEENIATVIQHFKTQAPAPPPFNPPRMRGFFSAAKDMLSGLPDVAAAISNPTLAAYNAIKEAPQRKQDIIEGVKAHGIPAEVVHQVGQAMGIPAHDIVKDYNDKNWPALAGDVVTPIALASTVGGAVESMPAVKAAIETRAATKSTGKMAVASGQQVSSIVKAIPQTNAAKYTVSDINRARPYLEAEHTSAPIDSVESFHGSLNSAITQIEAHIGDYIAANPNDVIRTNPLRAVTNALSRNARQGAMEIGLREVSDLGLDKPMTVAQADKVRLQLNAENQAILKKNNYDIETARKADPGFAAREAASDALRDGVYNQLEARGISGVRELRLDEGALLKLRNATQRQIFNGAKAVSGTGANSVGRRIASQGVKVGSAGVGAGIGGTLGGPVGAVGGATVGGIIGEDLSKRIARPNLTRDALIQKAFEKPTGSRGPSYPTVPDTPSVRGLIDAPATRMPAAPDTSHVTVTTGPPLQPKIRGMLNAPARAMGPGPDASGPMGRTNMANAVIRRNPNTGRYERIYTSEVIK